MNQSVKRDRLRLAITSPQTRQKHYCLNVPGCQVSMEVDDVAKHAALAEGGMLS